MRRILSALNPFRRTGCLALDLAYVAALGWFAGMVAAFLLEAARHVSADMSRVRQIQPGLLYEEPPAQDKLTPEEWTPEALLAALSGREEAPLHKTLAA